MNRKQATFIAACLLPWGFAVAQTSSSDPHSGRITVTSPASRKVISGAPDRFTGSVRIRSLFDAKSPARSTGGEVTFQPGARSAWHTHPLGQVLIVTDGVGWVQQWGSPVQVMHKGDVVWIPPEVKHWHGAAPTEPVTHIALQEEQNGVNVMWIKKVTDEQYKLGK